MNPNILKEIAGIADYPIINTHSHHLPDDEIKGMNLTKLLSNSYVNWCGKPIPDGRLKSEITSWLNAVRTRSYFAIVFTNSVYYFFLVMQYVFLSFL